MSYESIPPENDTGNTAPCSEPNESGTSTDTDCNDRFDRALENGDSREDGTENALETEHLCIVSHEKESIEQNLDIEVDSTVSTQLIEKAGVLDVTSNLIIADDAEKAVSKRTINRHAYFFSFFTFAVLADQFTKAFAVYKLGYLVDNPTFGVFLVDYYSRIREFPWRQGEEGYKPAIDIVDGLLRWQLTTNTGAAYSMFSNNPGKLAVVSAILSVFLYFLYLRFGKGSVIWPIAFGLQIGGAIGNFIDRARLGEVVDFIATKVPGLSYGHLTMVDFPIYNVADACAVVGTIAIGLLFVVKDVSASNFQRKSRYEMNYFNEEKVHYMRNYHQLDQDKYTAFIEYLPKTNPTEKESDLDKVDFEESKLNDVNTEPEEISASIQTEVADDLHISTDIDENRESTDNDTCA